MPRKKLIETNQFPFHITNRSNNKEFFTLPIPILWEVMMKNIESVNHNYGIKTHAFILMSNHYHWVLSTPELNLSRGMTYFHREVAKTANKLSNRINHFFGGRYKWTLIDQEEYYWTCIKYVYRNSVRANLCRRVQEYQFSTLNKYNDIKGIETVDFFNQTEKVVDLDLDWLNQPFLKEKLEEFQLSLRKRKFIQK